MAVVQSPSVASVAKGSGGYRLAREASASRLPPRGPSRRLRTHAQGNAPGGKAQGGGLATTLPLGATLSSGPKARLRSVAAAERPSSKADYGNFCANSWRCDHATISCSRRTHRVPHRCPSPHSRCDIRRTARHALARSMGTARVTPLNDHPTHVNCGPGRTGTAKLRTESTSDRSAITLDPRVPSESAAKRMCW